MNDAGQNPTDEELREQIKQALLRTAPLLGESRQDWAERATNAVLSASNNALKEAKAQWLEDHEKGAAFHARAITAESQLATVRSINAQLMMLLHERDRWIAEKDAQLATAKADGWDAYRDNLVRFTGIPSWNRAFSNPYRLSTEPTPLAVKRLGRRDNDRNEPEDRRATGPTPEPSDASDDARAAAYAAYKERIGWSSVHDAGNADFDEGWQAALSWKTSRP